ncbi:MAG: hypothetical protein KGL11_14115 [Alphaproteobacteria bacterium]|nr:hypothetical protein [Alphaproteobacteria bacterium]
MVRRISPLVCTGLALLLPGCYTPETAAPAAPPGYTGSASGEYAPSTYAPSPPPPPVAETIPALPGPMVYWQPGHWAWTGTQWT